VCVERCMGLRSIAQASVDQRWQVAVTAWPQLWSSQQYADCSELLQVLTVSTASGAVYSYLAALPVVYDTCGTQLLHMTSLLEMSLVDAPTRTLLHSIQTETEPHFCALGPLQHAAVGINNQVSSWTVARSTCCALHPL
jgi:hypothetical protein